MISEPEPRNSTVLKRALQYQAQYRGMFTMQQYIEAAKYDISDEEYQDSLQN